MKYEEFNELLNKCIFNAKPKQHIVDAFKCKCSDSIFDTCYVCWIIKQMF